MEGPCLRPLLSRRHQSAFDKEGLGWLLDTVIPDPLYEERVQRIIVQLRAAAVCRAFLERVDWRPPPEDRMDPSRLGYVGIIRPSRFAVRRNYTDLAVLIDALPVSEKIKHIFWFLNREANEAKHQSLFNSRL